MKLAWDMIATVCTANDKVNRLDHITFSLLGFNLFQQTAALHASNRIVLCRQFLAAPD
ncbi:hypothetical protein SAMN05421863_1002168 [Nitrosomonas communis]|uniref:Uncharacterized protein n=1 Tax=Nitrosomonas communis TaxID=44574 RepID=A0A1I4JQM7_9PROT|nr:hypothetical protein SAMN05421863_1002168 [Nitrosomonas communis]